MINGVLDDFWKITHLSLMYHNMLFSCNNVCMKHYHYTNTLCPYLTLAVTFILPGLHAYNKSSDMAHLFLHDEVMEWNYVPHY